MAGELESRVEKFIFRVRRGCRYSPQDVWVKMEDGGVRLGITDYLQRLSGDATFVTFTEAGSLTVAGATLVEVETIKTTVEVPAPVAGTIVAVNEALLDRPELVNEDPYGEGWLVVLTPASEAEVLSLLDDAAYFALMQGKLALMQGKLAASAP